MTSAEIVHELQAARPVAPYALRARIELIADSTPAPRPSAASRFLPRRRALLVALPAAAALAVASAGVIGLAESGRDDAALATRDAGYGESGVAPKAGAGDTAPPATTTLEAQGAPGPTTGRAQQVSASLTLQVADTDELSDATQQALQVTRSLGGYVVSVSYATGTDGTAALTLRVPTAKVQDAIARLSSLGTILAQQVQIDDLQESIDALDRRIANLQERIARLTAQLDQPGLDEETRATLQARRSAARAELAAARGDRAGHLAAARLATIQLTLVTDPETSTVPPVPSRFDRALDEAVEILAWEATVALYALVLAGPFLLLGAAWWWGRKALQRRETDRLLEAS